VPEGKAGVKQFTKLLFFLL